MILTCPTCAARYDADTGAFPATGRAVRCAACGHSWLAGPDGLAVDGPVLPGPPGLSRAEVERARREAMEPARSYRARIKADARRAAWIRSAVTWSAAAGAAAGALALAFVWRDEVVDIWPKAASVFAMAGAPANATGMEFLDVTAQRSFEGDMPVLAVRGSVRNVSGKPARTPPVVVVLRDQTGLKLFEWTVRTAPEALPPGHKVAFQTRVGHPPLEAFDVSVTFASPSSAPDGVKDPPGSASAGLVGPAPAPPSPLEPDPAAPAGKTPSAGAPMAAQDGYDVRS
jgi:predicted Zn finger-like uncharacterized protein